MNQTTTKASPASGAASAQELFALTDEQILEIEPQATGDSAAVEQPILAVPAEKDGRDKAIQGSDRSAASTQSRAAETLSQARVPTLPAEPPAWLARQMKDPWSGEEARELWDGVQRAQAEAAEYRAAIATPAEAKSFKDIYPQGIEQARAASQRARMLDEFDAAYFGANGKSSEEVSAMRTALAQKMLRDDPAAFVEMVAAGVKALEEAKARRSNEVTAKSVSPANQATNGADSQAANIEGRRHLAAYSEFEKAANADLEKSVGGAIERALRQALPLADQSAPNGGSQAGVPTLQERLGSAVRQEIEKALQGDRQLGEQVAQVLSSRRFDETARAQVVRLINERAQQLVPSATKRVLHDWTQTTLAAHRSKTEKQETATSRADLAPAQQGSGRPATTSQQRATSRTDAPPPPRGRIDYKKLSDEQILDL